VVLDYGADSLSVTVTDNGSGFTMAETDGTGIVGMRERAETLGGSLDVAPGPAGGTRVQASLPLRSRS
jgi:signal transduction histidine kinase